MHTHYLQKNEMGGTQDVPLNWGVYICAAENRRALKLNSWAMMGGKIGSPGETGTAGTPVTPS